MIPFERGKVVYRHMNSSSLRVRRIDAPGSAGRASIVRVSNEGAGAGWWREGKGRLVTEGRCEAFADASSIGQAGAHRTQTQ
jgi:hypothetical protein